MATLQLTPRRTLPGKMFRGIASGVSGRGERTLRQALNELSYVGLDVELDVDHYGDRAGHVVHTPGGSFLFECRDGGYSSKDLAAITMRARVLSAHLGYRLAPAICLVEERSVTLRRHAGVWVLSEERLGDWADLQLEPALV